jgi:hypothetical protein
LRGWLRRLLWSYYGNAFDANFDSKTVTVGTSVVQVHKHNPARFWVSFSNSGTATMAISRNPAMTITDGYQLAAGQSCGFLWTQDGQKPGDDWYAIAASGSQTLYTETQVATGEQDSDPVPGE